MLAKLGIYPFWVLGYAKIFAIGVAKKIVSWAPFASSDLWWIAARCSPVREWIDALKILTRIVLPN